MVCECCCFGAEYSAEDADDYGLFSCPRCYAVHTWTQAAAASHDVPAPASGDLAGPRDKRRRVGGAGGLGGAGAGAPCDDPAAAGRGGADGRARARAASPAPSGSGGTLRPRCSTECGRGRTGGRGRGPRGRGGRDASFILSSARLRVSVELQMLGAPELHEMVLDDLIPYGVEVKELIGRLQGLLLI
ncbi:hypothetical protein C2845_PM05G25070 [Panicum miliaceum]|uniref:Uncharacterized protein n=1 Tax=Panicum miliaceum TaxID=4540 RepID=A0A3L6SXD5_PANMI|nr:hypothetical protein C2845_PM05G25070 [Panicum miliaceum]